MKEALVMLGFWRVVGLWAKIWDEQDKNRPRVPHWGNVGLGWRRLN